METTFDASSGPSGENPAGTVVLANGPSFRHTSEVTCLRVSGNTATVGFKIVDSTDPSLLGWTGHWDLVDRGPGQTDRVTLGDISPQGFPADCNSFTQGPPASSGDVQIIDVQPFPTSKNQCKKGGWRNFGSTFKNQGQCVSFVATGGKKQP